MPVATQAAMKGVTVGQLEEMGVEILLGNTYHLGLRPGEEAFREITRRKNAAEKGPAAEADGVRANMDGLHFFEGWKGNILTDSGGFQLVSLLKLATITEEGVRFQSTHGGGGRIALGDSEEASSEEAAKRCSLLLSPEDSIRIQNAIGGDIMMQLDDVVHVLTTGPRVEEAARRSLRWLDRSIAANENSQKQCIFGIVQGALDTELRRECLQEITKRTACKGFAIGGLSGGESKDQFWRIVRLCTSEGGLPEEKPRYCMGVGYPEDIMVCIALGVDMFDCVFACRTARFGSALTSTGKIQLGKQLYANDSAPLDAACNCMTCKTYTRAYLHAICSSKHSISATLLSYHNIAYLINLTRGARTAILEGRFTEYVQDFFSAYYPDQKYPQWAVDALRTVHIELKSTL
ncbi:unnamed protein product [Phytomonas sp. Hart1]|nr:unnamed protein product [Phytomonas sp. Hart1]|eukprot:CCW68063.1 unnamed protein product [Phytomonas sp. isolate Hart1]